MFLRSLWLVALVVLLVSCSRTTEINVMARIRSPDGLREATVEEHVYGPHFGGEVPAVEVHIRQVQAADDADGLVFQASSEGNDVSIQWVDASRLVITHSSKVPVDLLNRSYAGVLVQLVAR